MEQEEQDEQQTKLKINMYSIIDFLIKQSVTFNIHVMSEISTYLGPSETMFCITLFAVREPQKI